MSPPSTSTGPQPFGFPYGAPPLNGVDPNAPPPPTDPTQNPLGVPLDTSPPAPAPPGPMGTPQAVHPPPQGNLSRDELQVHRRTAMRMVADGKSPAQVSAYLDSVGVPYAQDAQGRRKQTVLPPELHNDPGLLGGLMLEAIQGATFGFGDEAVGALTALVTKGMSTDQGIDMVRSQIRTFEGQHKILGTAAQIVGAVKSGGGILGKLSEGAGTMFPAAAKALSGGGRLATIARNAASGAVGGGIYAAGQAQGGVGDRLQAVPGGAAVGAIATPVIMGIGSAVGSVLRPILRGLPLGEKLPGVGSADEQADQILTKALQRDGKTLDEVLAAAQQAAAKGQPMTLADLSGENMTALGSTIQSMPGQGKQALLEGLRGRQQDQGERLLDVIAGKTKMGIQNVFDLRNTMMAQQAATAAPLYEAAYQQSVPVTPELRTLLDNPIFRKAYSIGQTMAATEGKTIAPMTKLDLLATARLLGTGQTVERVADEIPVQGIDYMKRGLNKLIDRGFQGKNSIDRTGARSLWLRLNAVLQHVDAAVPAYAQARATWGGDAEAMNALEMGRKFLTTKADELPGLLAELTPSQQDLFKVGALENIRDAIYNSKHDAPNIAKAVFGGKSNALRIERLFGTDAEAIKDAIWSEARMSHVFQSIHGSRTTPLAMASQDLQEQIAPNLPTLSVGSIVRAGSRHVLGRLTMGFGEQVADNIASKLQKGLDNPYDLVGLLSGLKATQQKVAQKVGQRAFSPAAAAIGAQLAP